MMGIWRRSTSPGTDGPERGAGVIEYSALVCVAAVLLAALVVPLRGHITPYVRYALCEIFAVPTGGHCESPAEAKRKKQQKQTPCVVDTKSVTAKGDNYIVVGGGVSAQLSRQKQSDGSLIETVTLTGKIGLALAVELDKHAKVGGESDITGAISLQLTFASRDVLNKFNKKFQNKQVDEVSRYTYGSKTAARIAIKYGKYVAPAVLLKVMYDAAIATADSMHIDYTKSVSIGFQQKTSAEVGQANGEVNQSVATTSGKNSDGTSYRSYTMTIGAAGQYNFAPDGELPEGVEVDTKAGGELTGTVTMQVNYDRSGKAKNAQITEQLQVDGTATLAVSGTADIKGVGVSAGGELTGKHGGIIVISKNLTLNGSEKSTLTKYEDTPEPARVAVYAVQVIKAMWQNRGGKFSLQVYTDNQREGKASASVELMAVDVAQGSVSGNSTHDHLVTAYNYDPDNGGWQRDEQCVAAA